MTAATTVYARFRETALRSLRGRSGANVGRIRDGARRAVECVSIRLGWEPFHLGFAFGWLAAGFLAPLGDALILDPYNNWLTFEGGAPVFLSRANQDG